MEKKDFDNSTDYLNLFNEFKPKINLQRRPNILRDFMINEIFLKNVNKFDDAIRWSGYTFESYSYKDLEKLQKFFKDFVETASKKPLSKQDDLIAQKIFRAYFWTLELKGLDVQTNYLDVPIDLHNEILEALKTPQAGFVGLKGFLLNHLHEMKEFCDAYLRILDRVQSDTAVFEMLCLENLNEYFLGLIVRLESIDRLDSEIIEFLCKLDALTFKAGVDVRKVAFENLKLYKLCEFDKDFFKNKMWSVFKIELVAKFGSVAKVIDNFVLDSFKIPMPLAFLYAKQNLSSDFENLKNACIDGQVRLFAQHIVSLRAFENDGALKHFGFDDKGDFRNLADSYGNLLLVEADIADMIARADSENLGANLDSEKLLLARHKDILAQSDFDFVKDFDFSDFKKDKIIERNENFSKFLNEYFKEFL